MSDRSNVNINVVMDFAHGQAVRATIRSNFDAMVAELTMRGFNVSWQFIERGELDGFDSEVVEKSGQ